VSAVAAPRRAGRREWLGLAVIALPCVLYAMDLTVLNLAVPHISAQPRDADRRPRAARGGRRHPGPLHAVADPQHVPRPPPAHPGRRVWISSFTAGAAIGPLLGGLLLEWFWWGSVFLIAVPVMVVLLALGPVLLPEFRDPDAGRLDLASAALSLAAVLAVIFGLKQLAQDGPGWPLVLSVVAGLVLGTVFVRRQRTSADPLIDLSLFGNHAFSAALATNTLDFFVSFGALLFIAQYLQLVLGLSPLEAGLWMLPSSLGLAPLTTLATDLMIGVAPPERAGAVSAVAETTSELGGALGIAVLGSIGAAVYRGEMAGDLPPGVPPEAAAAAGDTLGAALAAAQQLPAQLGTALVDTAQAAFTQGLHLVFAVNAGLTLGIAALVAVLLRGVRAGHGAGGPA
jgi:MFS transporter, DHA2 family, multidrug resistance protein